MTLDPVTPADWPEMVATVSADAHGIWMLQGATIAGNAATVAVQHCCGFRIVGRRDRIARRDGIWHDTVLLERRSTIIGVD